MPQSLAAAMRARLGIALAIPDEQPAESVIASATGL
jgi:hypothetical protein